LHAAGTGLHLSVSMRDTLLVGKPMPEFNGITPIRTDKGLFGGKIGKGRMYCDILLPALTPQLLIDVGMSMSKMPGIIGMAPGWFAMFSPLACPKDELFGAVKSNSAIMVTWRTYF